MLLSLLLISVDFPPQGKEGDAMTEAINICKHRLEYDLKNKTKQYLFFLIRLQLQLPSADRSSGTGI